jgi:hypothetical protein
LGISVAFGLVGLSVAPLAHAQVCDPYAAAPRPSCSWDTTACNWVCPGYMGSDVTAEVFQLPKSAGTVTVNMQVACSSQVYTCSASAPTGPTETATQHCQLLAGLATSSACASAGFGAGSIPCAGPHPYFTVWNNNCGLTPMALGISGAQSPFDQTYQGGLPDGEWEAIVAGQVPPAVPALPHAWQAVAVLVLGLAALSLYGRIAGRRPAAAAAPSRASAPWRG